MNARPKTPAGEAASDGSTRVTRVRFMPPDSGCPYVELTLSDGRIFGSDKGSGPFRSCQTGERVKRGGPLEKVLDAARWLFTHGLWKGET